jgi:hypothetical protein
MNPNPQVWTVPSVPSSNLEYLRGIELKDGVWNVRDYASIQVHSVWNRRIEAVVARNTLDYQALMRIRQDAAAGLKTPRQVPVMLPWEVTQRLQDGFDLSRLDDSDATLERLFGNDVTLFDEFEAEDDVWPEL